jgi:hypothetical protein
MQLQFESGRTTEIWKHQESRGHPHSYIGTYLDYGGVHIYSVSHSLSASGPLWLRLPSALAYPEEIRSTPRNNIENAKGMIREITKEIVPFAPLLLFLIVLYRRQGSEECMEELETLLHPRPHFRIPPPPLPTYPLPLSPATPIFFWFNHTRIQPM